MEAATDMMKKDKKNERVSLGRHGSASVDAKE